MDVFTKAIIYFLTKFPIIILFMAETIEEVKTLKLEIIILQ